MEQNKKGNKLAIWILSIAGILVVLMIAWLAYQFISKKHSKNEPLPVVSPTPVIVPTTEPLITPTIIPSAKSGLKTFIYSSPASPYSFEYPSSWGIVEIGHDNIVRLNFAGRCRVEFSNKASEKNSGTGQSKDITYAERTFQMTSFKNNGITIEAYTLSNTTSKDGFSLVTVDLPSSNTSQCQQTVDQILSSVTFGK